MKASEKLLQKYTNGEADPLEQSIVEQWYADLDIQDAAELTDAQKQEQLEYIRQNLPGYPMKVVKRWPRVAAGIAATVAFIVLCVYFYDRQRSKQDIEIVKDLAPASPGATLTLANGKKIRLADAGNGELAKEAGVSISKSSSGQLIYEMQGSAAEQPQNNTLTTANGETWQLKLPDGSMVYLNAASSLTYNTALNENGLRRVQLTGEAYFEIANDKAHPFVVKTALQEVEVLGTHFNINSYPDEATKTTLLEGSIRLNHTTILKPGEQAVVNNNGNIFVEKVDTDNAVAWRNGYFQLDGKDLESIMREVSRWYDVEVVYENDNLKKMAFVGTVSRYKNVSQVLKTLQMTNTLGFKIAERKIIINQADIK